MGTMGNGAHIVIVGPHRPATEQISALLRQRTHYPCLVAEQGQPLTPVRGSERRLVIHDCDGWPGTDLSQALAGKLGQLPADEIHALYNLDRLAEVECMAVARGFRGFFYRQDPAEALVLGVNHLFGGGLWLPRDKMEQILLAYRHLQPALLPTDTGTDILTPREMEILALVTTGANNDRIGSRLDISPHTVKTHIYNIFKKLDVSNRMEAALWYMQQCS